MNSKKVVQSMLLAGLFAANMADAAPKHTSSGEILNAKSTDLVVATWNVEHLAAPITDGCRPRSEAEIAGLRAYAQGLDADIVALQEVGSVEAAQLIFPAEEWQVFISERPDSESYVCRKTGFNSTQQKVAYAVRNSVNVEEVKSRKEFGLDMPGLRYGLEMTVESEMGSMTLLNLHMKSGCFVDNYTREESEACEIFKQQTPILDGWVEQKEKEGQPYVILGDFNHRLSAPYNQLTRELSSNSDASASSLENTTADMISCHPWYPALIDHIIVGNLNRGGLNKEAKVHAFENNDPEAMLSDHCAISLTLEPKSLPLTNAVKWQTKSKEYKYLTTETYQRATATLNNIELSDTPWVVVMDIDETIMDNSAYQVNLDRIGGRYTSKSWAAWVASEKATLVPGVVGYIEAVLERGGKLALVTNRKREQDHHTWRNMLALGLPLTLENTCLLGRAHEDEQAVEDELVINDKDLRRMQINNGTASCFESESKRHKNFGKQQIVMQVGDNIEDFANVTQEDADILKLLAESNGELVLLPNPMYGSWR